MDDLINELEKARRSVGTRQIPAGSGRTVELRRRYDASAGDVWAALTDPARMSLWFLPVTGDLRPGGHYELKGSARGEIITCEPPRHLSATWLFGDNPPPPADIGLVTVELETIGDTTTELRLEHAAVVDEDRWHTYGPGATGVGWDLALLCLALFLRGGAVSDPRAFEASPEARAFTTRSSQEWSAAHETAGATPAQARDAAARTAAFYAPEPDSPAR
jgi:uncharacterized protein YndB with AHSA1/START domain